MEKINRKTQDELARLTSFPRLDPNPIIELNSSGRIIFFNPATEKALENMGMKKGNLPFFLPSDLHVILKDLKKDCESFFNREVEIKERIFKETIIVMPSLKTVRIYAHDITERERSGETLREGEARLKEAQRLAHVGSWDWDAITDTTRCSAEFYRVFNSDPQEPSSQNYRDHLKIYSLDSAQRLDAAVKRAMQTGEPYELDLEIAYPIGRTRWISARGEAKRDEDGRIIGLRGTAQDITERRQAYEARLENEARLRVALTPINMAVFNQDLKLCYTWFYQPQVGYTTEHVIGKTDFELFPPDAARQIVEIKRRVIEKGTGARGVIEITSEDRTEFHDFVVEPLLNPEGQVLGITGASLDITERRLREKELSSKSRALEELNTALKVLIDHYKNDQIELEERIVSNIRVRIVPYIEKLKGSGLNIGQSTLLEIIERNFDDISSPFLKLMSSEHFRLTPKEVEIVSLIKDGKATKEIAQILGIGKSTVDSYRDNIRGKLGIANKKINLRTYILSLKNA